MTGYVETVEKALFLRRFGVPYWGLTYVFGHSDMYWYRLVEYLGRFDVVGTTVRSADKLPEHLLADEKFTSIAGQERFVTLTVGSDVVLGAAVALTAQADELATTYGDFPREALRLHFNYAPKTLNLDGWKQARLAWRRLFPTVVVIGTPSARWQRRARLLWHHPRMRRAVPRR